MDPLAAGLAVLVLSLLAIYGPLLGLPAGLIALATALLLGDLAARRRFPRGAVMAAFPCVAGSLALVGIATISTLVTSH